MSVANHQNGSDFEVQDEVDKFFLNIMEPKNENFVNGLGIVEKTPSQRNGDIEMTDPKPTPQILSLEFNGVMPQIMLFAPKAEQYDSVMSGPALNKLPKRVIANLTSQGVMEGTILKMTNYGDYDSMLSLKTYLETGTSISPQTRGQSRDSLLKAIDVDTETERLLSQEISLYQFAIKLQFGELRTHVANNLMDGFPKSVQGIWELVTHVYTHADKMGDSKLKNHIIDLIYANNKDVTRLPQFIPLMKKFNKQEGTLGAVLFESYIAASESRSKKELELPKKDVAMASRNDVPVKQEPSPQVVAPSPKAATVATKLPHSLLPEDLIRIFDGVVNGTLVVALEDGYGSLTQRPDLDLPARNRNFTFQAGELLLSNTMESAKMGHNNTIVYNSKGDRGDILSQLVRPIPKHMGILGKGKWLLSDHISE
jgi:hypothetical protein